MLISGKNQLKKYFSRQLQEFLIIGRSSKWLGNMTDIHAIWDRAPVSQPRIGVKIRMKVI